MPTLFSPNNFSLISHRTPLAPPFCFFLSVGQKICIFKNYFVNSGFLFISYETCRNVCFVLYSYTVWNFNFFSSFLKSWRNSSRWGRIVRYSFSCSPKIEWKFENVKMRISAAKKLLHYFLVFSSFRRSIQVGSSNFLRIETNLLL